MTTTPFATYEAVEVLWRPLSDAEQAKTTKLLTQASAIMRSAAPTLDARIASGTLSADVAEMVAVRMVLRFLRNPEGFKTESDGDYSYTRDDTATSGELELTASDRRALGLGGGKVGTIHVRPAEPVGPWDPYAYDTALGT
ncbi:MAG: putative 14 [Frankiales bacterium]|nr:putative 14 [Frankiales bacterium]